MKKRYARAKPIKKENEENKITKWDIVRTLINVVILCIGLICICLIVYLQKGEKNELKNRTKDKNTRYV